MSFEFKAGFIPSEPDHRDYIYGAVVNMEADTLPPSFFYPRIPVNKQVIGDCVGQSSRAIKAIQEGHGLDFAPDFVYSQCKKLDGAPDQEGTQPRIAMQVLKNIGAARKGLYDNLTANTPRPEPSAAAVDDAKPFVISAYARIQTVDEIKHALVNQGPVMGAVIVTDSFMNAPGGVIPNPQGSILGGHAICIDGYDDSKQQFRFINSWGEEWGDEGYGWLPYSFLTFTTDIGMRFFIEAWSSVDVPNQPPQPAPIPNPDPQPNKLYHVQVGAYSKQENAQAMLAKLKDSGFDGFIKYE